MLDIQTGIARGTLARVTVLRGERQTDAAQLLLDRLSDRTTGTLGYIPKTVEPFSGEANLRERADLERVRLYGRRQSAESISRAKVLAREILARVGPRAEAPTLDGESRARFLSAFAIALANLGEEDAAIRVVEYLLGELGLPADPVQIGAHLAEHPRAALSARRIAIHLNNISVRRTRLGYLARLAGSHERARLHLERARLEAQQSMELRGDGDTVRVVDSRLLCRHNTLRAELELASSIEHAPDRDRALEEVESAFLEVIRTSYERATVPPTSRLVRAAGYGMTLVERAVIAEAEGDIERARSLGSVARVAMKAAVDLWTQDADEPIALTIRYGEACRVVGAIPAARRIWQRTRDREILFRGADAPSVRWLDDRLARLPANP